MDLQIAGASLFGALLSKFHPVTCLKFAAGLMMGLLPVMVFFCLVASITTSVIWKMDLLSPSILLYRLHSHGWPTSSPPVFLTDLSLHKLVVKYSVRILGHMLTI